MDRQGGCLCGHVRYLIDAEPLDAGFCHCKLCQGASGAPVVAWLTVAVSGFRYQQGQVKRYRSSPHYQREFCPHCGTQLVFRKSNSATTLDVTLASLDDVNSVAPQYHIWCQSQVSWLHLEDPLPRYPDAGPDSDH